MNPQQQLSPAKYVQTKARSLPIDACYINGNWKDAGMAEILVVRRHTNGHVTYGVYLVDLFAMGTKDSFYNFNVAESMVNELLERWNKKGANMIKTEYPLVHNIIYGANAYAEEIGFKPCKEFALMQYILEEDTEDIELMDIEFGKDGKPVFIERIDDLD